MNRNHIGIMMVAAGKLHLQLAIIQAMSLKMISLIPTAIVTNCQIPSKYINLFDHIYYDNIDGMYGTGLAMMHSPFEWTLKTDADVIFPYDITTLLLEASKLSLLNAPSFVFDYKGNKIDNTQYRYRFIQNNMPSVYSGMMLFKHKDYTKHLALEFIDIERNWNSLSKQYFNEEFPFMIDEALSILFYRHNITPSMPISFTHMKPELCNQEHLNEWPDTLELSYYYHKWFIGPVRQIWPIHVVKKQMMLNIMPRMEKDYESIY